MDEIYTHTDDYGDTLSIGRVVGIPAIMTIEDETGNCVHLPRTSAGLADVRDAIETLRVEVERWESELKGIEE